MAKIKHDRRSKAALESRFDFIGDGVAVGDRSALGSAIFDVEEKATGAELSLKVWRKTGKPVDEDLRELWLHEMRQVQRVMSYAGARDVVVDIIEFVEDDNEFGVLLERVGQPLSERRKRVSRQHWLRNLAGPRARILFWNNIKRIVRALGIIHAQGLVHGRLALDAIMTEGSDEPDFRLGGFEWSLWLGANKAQRSHAKIGPDAAAVRAESYSFAADWRALGALIAECFDAEIKSSGDVQTSGKDDSPIALHTSERVLIKRLFAPSRMEQLDADSIARSIDDLIGSIARAVSARAGTFLLTFDRQSKLGEAIYNITNGEIPIDEYRRQLDWVRGDLDNGATLLVPKNFDAATSWLKLVTDNLVYKLRAFREEGTPVWDIAICQAVETRFGNFSLGENNEHAIHQPISVAANSREVQELRGRLGPDVLDWSTFATPSKDDSAISENDVVRPALLLVQIIEAVVKALDVYPVEIVDIARRGGQKYVTLRAEPDNDRDRLAKKVGLSESATALSRLFEEDNRDAEAKWRLSQAASLGANRNNDIIASFGDVVDHKGRRCYQFEIDEELPDAGPFFLRTERDTGTEQVIGRRLRNIGALDTRVDLTEMLADPWLVRRSSREAFGEQEKKDYAFLDLDKPKQNALIGLWSTLPSYFVVGPPGVGKTKLATEVIRRRFLADPSTRLLISAQGHDALDNLQEKISDTLRQAALSDLLVVRSTTSERRSTSDAEIHRAGLSYLEKLSQSMLARDAPTSIRNRISNLKAAAGRLETARDTVSREERSGLGAVSHLVLDAANIVISTANSPDIERLVEAREQFDWVIVEEAAKGTGPELVGPLMLSGRRLLIGDHYQLPPFEADRLVKILANHSLVSEALELADQLIGPLLRDDELDELGSVFVDQVGLRNIADMALRLLEPFRTFVEEDERRTKANPSHRQIAATLTEQRRMDPAIAEIVSKAFYQGRLSTEAKRADAAENEESPIIQLGALPQSPVVVVDFPHISSTGHGVDIERNRPRWHNPSEVQSVIDVLRLVRARDAAKPPTLAILSPYKAQVEKLHERVASIRTRELVHLDEFRPVRSNGAFIGTVDSFQGSEADLVILSLVRNNARTGGSALGFLRDRRRMNVALSRAKSKLVIVGSLTFLKEAVRGVNPDAESHDLSFLTEMVNAIYNLKARERRGVPLASLIQPSKLKNF